MAEQLQLMAAAEIVNEKEDHPHSAPDLWFKAGRDQLDPTWQLISPNSKP